MIIEGLDIGDFTPELDRVERLQERIEKLEKHVERLDDTVTRLTLEMKAMTELMITPDDFDYLGCLKSTYEKHVTNQENEDE